MRDTFRLTEQAVHLLAENHGTPLLVLSTTQVQKNYEYLQQHLPGINIYYAMKANPNEKLLEALIEIGSHFDVASDGEMLTLSSMGVSGERMVYANPIKTDGGFSAAKRTGVYKFTYDSVSEVDKMAKAVPGGTVLLRIRVDNPRAHIDLNKKFGAHHTEAMDLLRYARNKGLNVAGLCFHVGSQSKSSAAYLESIRVCRQLFDEAAVEGFDMSILDIGGGFPIAEIDDNFDPKYMFAEISAALKEKFPTTEIWCEPGRFMCGTTVNLITKVIGVQQRNNQQWYFLDEGVYGTFSGVIFDQWDYELESFKAQDKIAAVFAGPSCDSLDIMFRDKMTAPLELDDLILVPNCGAYTSASATVFNGFSKAQTIVWEDVKNK